MLNAHFYPITRQLHDQHYFRVSVNKNSYFYYRIRSLTVFLSSSCLSILVTHCRKLSISITRIRALNTCSTLLSDEEKQNK